MPEARLHWFWRGTIAVALAFVINAVITSALARVLSPAAWGVLPFAVSIGLSRRSLR
jgi:hypothetical protein